MTLIGLTGGIGSGKTTVAKMFEELGVPVYYADDEAKGLMNRSKVIRRQLIAILGSKSYDGNKINRPYIATKIFNDSDLLDKVNAVVHPKVASHFKRWISKQNSRYIIQEAAILFENGNHKKFDRTILVVAPVEERIKRVIKRDSSSIEKVMSVINNQWSDERKIELSDFIITNNELPNTEAQVQEIHQKIMSSH